MKQETKCKYCNNNVIKKGIRKNKLIAKCINNGTSLVHFASIAKHTIVPLLLCFAITTIQNYYCKKYFSPATTEQNRIKSRSRTYLHRPNNKVSLHSKQHSQYRTKKEERNCLKTPNRA